MSSEPHARLHALDGLRGAMMLLGLVFHGACSYVTADITKAWPYRDAAQSQMADFLMSYLHAFRMPVFFVLAGFFAAMLLEKRGSVGLLNNRFQRIAVPFAVGLLVLFPLTTFAFIFGNVVPAAGIAEAWNAVIASTGAASSFVPRITIHLWFLYYLLYFYLGAVVIVAACKRLPQNIRGGCRACFSHARWAPCPACAAAGRGNCRDVVADARVSHHGCRLCARCVCHPRL